MKKNRDKSVGLWLGLGVFTLIMLLMLWLTFADLMGQTDIACL